MNEKVSVLWRVITDGWIKLRIRPVFIPSCVTHYKSRNTFTRVFINHSLWIYLNLGNDWWLNTVWERNGLMMRKRSCGTCLFLLSIFKASSVFSQLQREKLCQLTVKMHPALSTPPACGRWMARSRNVRSRKVRLFHRIRNKACVACLTRSNDILKKWRLVRRGRTDQMIKSKMMVISQLWSEAKMLKCRFIY